MEPDPRPAQGGDSPPGSTAPAPPAEDPSRAERAAATLRPYVAVLIAAIAVAAAAATWSAEVAATSAESATQQGVAVTIAATGSRLASRAEALQHSLEVQQVLDLQNASPVLATEVPAGTVLRPGSDPAYPDQTQASEALTNAAESGSSPEVVNLIAAEYVQEWALRNAWVADNAFTAPAPGVPSTSGLQTYQIERATDSLSATAVAQGNAVSRGRAGVYFTSAERSEAKRAHLLYVDLGLVAALVLVTLAQLATRTRAFFTLAGIGASMLVGGAMALALLEV